MQTSLPLRFACFALSLSAASLHGQTVAVPVSTSPTAVTVTTGVGVVVVATPANLPPSTLPVTGTTAPPSTTGETAITLDFYYSTRFVPPSRVTVPAGETLRITGPNYGGRAVPWSRDGKEIPGTTGNVLVIPSVSAGDAGVYGVGYNDPRSSIIPSQTLVLSVGPVQRLTNLSNRSTLAAGAGQTFSTGFVVGGGSSSAEAKKIIIRAIGPSLSLFGVGNTLRFPILRIFDSMGKAYTNGYAYPTVVGGLTYETDLANSLAKSGAFPTPANTLDAVLLLPFPPGAYTAQVSSGDQTAGEVLLEIYEVP